MSKPDKHVTKHSDTREALMRRIAKRKAEGQPYWDLMARLKAAMLRDLKRECRAPRKVEREGESTHAA